MLYLLNMLSLLEIPVYYKSLCLDGTLDPGVYGLLLLGSLLFFCLNAWCNLSICATVLGGH